MLCALDLEMESVSARRQQGVIVQIVGIGGAVRTAAFARIKTVKARKPLDLLDVTPMLLPLVAVLQPQNLGMQLQLYRLLWAGLHL